MTEHTADRQLRERARAVIPGGMYGHQSAPGAAYPQFMHGGRGARIWDVDARSQTPIVALLVFAVIDLGVMIYGYFQTSAFGTLVGATAIIPYIIYFLITLAYAIKRRTLDSIPGQ